jgi:hypothetical protein
MFMSSGRGKILLASLIALTFTVRFLAYLIYQHTDNRWCTMIKINVQILLCACAMYGYLLLHINDDVWQDSTPCLHLHVPSSFLTPALSAREPSSNNPHVYQSGKYWCREPTSANISNPSPKSSPPYLNVSTKWSLCPHNKLNLCQSLDLWVI